MNSVERICPLLSAATGRSRSLQRRSGRGGLPPPWRPAAAAKGIGRGGDGGGAEGSGDGSGGGSDRRCPHRPPRIAREAAEQLPVPVSYGLQRRSGGLGRGGRLWRGGRRVGSGGPGGARTRLGTRAAVRRDRRGLEGGA